jgi:D-3-phosphoglycerate dehydrogenase
VLSPHAAFYSVEAERDLRRKSAQNIITWMRTGRPDYVVARERDGRRIEVSFLV